jgi:hypothetical protein
MKVINKKECYAVTEKFKAKGIGYEPTVSVSMKFIKVASGDRGKVVLTVMGSCNCILQKVIDKLFQSFSTTKSFKIYFNSANF